MNQKEASLRYFGNLVTRLAHGENLSRAETREGWRHICEETQPDLQQGAFIAALQAKPATAEEIVGTFEALYQHDTTKATVSTTAPLIDNCGTGADSLKTLNVSTGAAIVAAACGQKVVRHAARAITSHCGSVDVLEALGINVQSAPALPLQSLAQAGICVWNAFLPEIHPKTLARVLSQIRFGSTINVVGPLLSPTMPAYKLMGVASLDLIDLMIDTLHKLGFKSGFVMHGLEQGSARGMDELSTLGPTHIAEFRDQGEISRYQITPEALGLPRARYEDLAACHDVHENALVLLRVLMAQDSGPRRDIICLNAAPMLTMMGQAEDLRAGIAMAREAITDGRAFAKLRAWVRWQNDNPEVGQALLETMVKRI